MSPPRKVASVLTLTEDGGKDGTRAFETIEALVRCLFKYLDKDCRTSRIDFVPATGEAREVLVANQYTNRRDPRRRQLYQLVAAQLRLGDGFVVHHFDGDRTWGERDRKNPLEAKPIQKEILDHVRALLALKGVTSEEVETMLQRYLRLVPYREIEAWLYQNTEQTRDFACGRPQCGCYAKLDGWRDDRTRLDEVPHPPDALPCVGKRHNKELAASMSVELLESVHHAGKSLAATINALRECPALLDAIERAYNRSPTSPA